MCSFILLLFLYFCLSENITGQELTSWEMHNMCGNEVSIYDSVGEVVFDASELAYTEHECTLTVTPDPLGAPEHNMVLFYFTQFEQTNYCDVFNISIKDGISTYDSFVHDFPEHLCTLTDQIFYPMDGSFFIQVNLNPSQNRKSLHGLFVLRFMSYFIGNCDDVDAYECDNGRCIPQPSNCSDVINVCSDVDDVHVCDDTEEITIEEWLGDIVRSIFLIIILICIVCLLKVMIKRGRKACEEGVDCFQGCCRDVRWKCRHCTNNINVRCPKIRLPEFIRRRLRSNNRNQTNAVSSGVTNAASNTLEGTSNVSFSSSRSTSSSVSLDIPEVTRVPPEMTSQLEPPSYDEVMASYPQSFPIESTDDPAPSYEEIITERTEQNTRLQSVDLPSAARDSTDNHLPESSIENNTISGNIENSSHVPLPARMDTDIVDRVGHDNQIIQSSQDLEDNLSVIEEYLNQYGIELSDNYSTDSDWDTDSHSQPERIIETQSMPDTDVNVEADDIQVHPPAYEEASLPPHYYEYMANVNQYRLPDG